MDIKDNILLATKIVSSTISVFMIVILAGVTAYVWSMRKDNEQYQYGKLIWGIVFGLCVLFTVLMILVTVSGFLNLMG